MAQIPTPWGEIFPPPSSLSLFPDVLSLPSCFALFADLGPLPTYVLTNYVPRFSVSFFLLPFHFIFAFFPSISIDDMGATSGGFLFFFWIFLFLSLFPNGFLLCDHGLDL